MKHLLLFIFCSCTLFTAKSQSISPSLDNEYCPMMEYTFTVSLPKPYSSMIGEGGCYLTQSPSGSGGYSISFKGKFADANQKQTFRVYFSDGSNYPFDFKKIKSLFYSAASSCSIIQPNTGIINAPLCQVVNTVISFSNIQWDTNFETPTFCFGSISNYEYLLPSGWSLNGTASTGNWMAGSNSATITSDQTTGNDQYIRIRPTNNCGSGLSNNYTPASIYISRPSPTLSITGAAPLCYPNSFTYTLNGVPSGSTINWNTSNSYYSLSPGGNTAIVTPTAAANGSTTINASIILSCGPTYSTSAAVSIGAPNVTFNIASYPSTEPSCYELEGIYSFSATQATGYPNTYTGFQWGWRNLTNNTISNDPTIYGSQYTFIPQEAGDYEIWVRPTNQCGIGALESVKTVTVYNVCGGLLRSSASSTIISTYPNPAKDIINLTVTESVKATKDRPKNKIIVELYEAITGSKVREWKFDKEQMAYSLSINGIKKGTYYLRYITGNYRKTKQIFVE